LNVGHTYVWGGDLRVDPKKVSSVLLGVDLNFDESYPKITKIYIPEEVDPQIKSPFYGTSVKVGDYIISVDGKEVKKEINFYSLLENRNKIVELMIMISLKKRPQRMF